MFFLFYLISLAIQLYTFVIILQVALSWLIAFDIINESNEAAQNLTAALKKLTDPVYKPLEKFVPPIGGIDIKPLVVIVGMNLLSSFIISSFFGMFL